MPAQPAQPLFLEVAKWKGRTALIWPRHCNPQRRNRVMALGDQTIDAAADAKRIALHAGGRLIKKSAVDDYLSSRIYSIVSVRAWTSAGVSRLPCKAEVLGSHACVSRHRNDEWVGEMPD